MHQPEIFKAMNQAREKISVLPEVLAVKAHVEVILHVTSFIGPGDDVENRRKVYDIEQQLMETYPDVNFIFHVIAGPPPSDAL